MNLLNKIGMELIDLKAALLGEGYPDIVIRSLEQTARHEYLDKELLMDEDFKRLMRTDCSLDEFKSLVLSIEHFVKSAEELEEEYNLQRDKVLLYLSDFATEVNLQATNHFDQELIAFTKSFRFGGTEMKTYFGVGQDVYESLMKRKGFVEKFFTLRYPLVLKSYIQSLDLEASAGFVLSVSPVFFDEEEVEYGIDFNVEIPLAMLEQSRPDELADSIKTLISGAQYYVADRFTA